MRPFVFAAFAAVALLSTNASLLAQISPTPELMEELMKGPQDTPVVMVNLLRFKATADAPDEGLTGAAAYQLYGNQMVQWVLSQGGRLIWSGQVDSWVIGDTEEEFHSVALMEYPSRAEFRRIISDPRVAEYSKHRTAGLEMQWLIATTTRAEGRSAAAPEGR